MFNKWNKSFFLLKYKRVYILLTGQKLRGTYIEKYVDAITTTIISKNVGN